MKNLPCLLLLTSALSCSIPTYNFHKEKVFKSNLQKVENVCIKNSPITNREFIIFLNWQIDVYGQSYPERVLQFLPLSENQDAIDKIIVKKIKPYTQNYKTYLNSQPYQKLIDNINDPIFKNYTLNPKYVDYPLIGLNKHQLFELSKWLTDRFNENTLIVKGILNFNPQQRDEDNWSLEAYLTHQYQGDVRKNLPVDKGRGERIPRWTDDFFIPTFRLPYASELQKIESNYEQAFELRPYEFQKNHFLYQWNDYYIKSFKKETMQGNSRLKLISPKVDFNLSELHFEKGTLDYDYYENKRYLADYYDNKEDHYDLPEKDIYGHMAFVVIGDDKSGKAIVADLKEIENGIDNTNSISWILYDSIRSIDQ